MGSLRVFELCFAFVSFDRATSYEGEPVWRVRVFARILFVTA